jgi:hypothetical protein
MYILSRLKEKVMSSRSGSVVKIVKGTQMNIIVAVQISLTSALINILTLPPILDSLHRVMPA